MQINITGRNLTVTDALRQKVEEKIIAACADKSLKITSAKVTMAVEKNRSKVDILVNYKNHEAAATAEGFENMYTVIDEAVAKLEVQLAKFLDKVQEHKAPPLRDVTAPKEPMPEN